MRLERTVLRLNGSALFFLFSALLVATCYRFGVPKPDGAVARAGDQGSAVGAEVERPDVVGVSLPTGHFEPAGLTGCLALLCWLVWLDISHSRTSLDCAPKTNGTADERRLTQMDQQVR